MHSRTKHIEGRHHFIRDHIHKDDCDIKFFDTNSQLVDIFTKHLEELGSTIFIMSFAFELSLISLEPM